MSADARTTEAAKALTDILDNGVRAFYEAQGCSLVHADLLFLDRERPADQVMAVLRGLAGFANADGSTRFAQILVVVPADEFRGDDLAAFTKRLDRFAALVRRRIPVRAIPENWITIRTCPVYQDEVLLDIVRSAPKESAVIVSQLAAYRRAGVAANEPGGNHMKLEEDLWAPHVLAIAKSLETIAAQNTTYVAILVGRGPPHRPELAQAMRTIEGGVLGSERTDDLDAALLAADDQISDHLQAGRIGAALALIDAMPRELDRQKPFVKVQLLQRARLPQMALDEIEREFAPHLDTYDSASLFKMAIMAEAAGGVVLAARLLRAAIPGLVQHEFLDAAMELSGRLDEFGLDDLIVARVEKLYPASRALKRRAAQQAADAGEFSRAADLFSAIAGSEEAATYYSALAGALPSTGSFDHDVVLAQLTRQNAAWRKGGHRSLVRQAIRRGQLYHAFRWTLDSEAVLFSPDLLLTVMEQLVLARTATNDLAISPEDCELAVRRVVRYLAAHPEEAGLRVRLVRWLEPSSVGFTGLAAILRAALANVFRSKQVTIQPPQDALSPEETDLLGEFLRAGMRWLEAQGNLVLGRSRMPATLLTLPADRICRGIATIIVDHNFDLSDSAEVKSVHVFVQLGALAAAHATLPAQDIEIVRLAAARLAPAGYSQMARDLAETAIEMAGDDPVRKRQAWLAMADIAHRGGNKYEALVALAAGAANDDDRDIEQAWEEYQIATRICRDMGFLQDALRGVDRMQQLADATGLGEANHHRLELLRLQIAQRQLRDGDLDANEIVPFLEQLAANASAAATREADATPIALTLGQALAQAGALGVTAPDAAQRAFAELLATLPKDAADLVRAMSTNTPSPEQLFEVYRRVQPARYAEDVGFDAQAGAILARRFLAAVDGEHTDAAILATEMLADRSVATPGWEAIGRPPPMAGSASALAASAQALSRDGANLLFLAIDADGALVRTNVSAGVVHPSARETAAVFDRAALEEWSQAYPYTYAFDTTTANLFDLSTRGIGISELPVGPIVIVADTRLQIFPPTLWRLGDDMIGELRPVAMVPSLSWLDAARKTRLTSSKRVAWISSAEDHGVTLAMVSDRLEPVLKENGILLDRGQHLPKGFSGAELAIVTAHGGLMDDAGFFQNVRDEGNVAVDIRDFAAAFHNIGLVVLFVCSGGRFDRHPDAVANLGLARQLLDAGCTTVIASPWPLDSAVTHRWLPAFMERWNAGVDAMTACFAANEAVRDTFSREPRDWLAMTVFGDPFLRTGSAGSR